jgi:Snf7.
MSSIAIGPQVDEGELEEELEALQQQDLEEKMLKTGTVPAQKLPEVANGERECLSRLSSYSGQRLLTKPVSYQQSKARLRPSRKTTKKPSSGNCRPKWRFEL